jgi:hypothetical protein
MRCRDAEAQTGGATASRSPRRGADKCRQPDGGREAIGGSGQNCRTEETGRSPSGGRPRGRGAMGPTPNARQKALHSCNSREKMAQAPPFTGRSWTQVIVSGQIRSGAQMKQRSYSPGCADAIRALTAYQPPRNQFLIALRALRVFGTPVRWHPQEALRVPLFVEIRPGTEHMHNPKMGMPCLNAL